LPFTVPSASSVRTHLRPPSRRRLLALGLQVSLVAGAVGGTVAFVRADHTVHLVVDGKASTLRTYASTVGAVLGAAKVTDGVHDTVAPAVTSKVGNGDTIVVRHGRPVLLTLGTTTRTVWVTTGTVQQAIDQLGLAENGEYVSASRSRPIGLAGIALSIRLPQQVTVLHDGRAQRITTNALTVRQLLAASRLTLGPHDTVSTPLTAYPTTGMVVRITRVRGAQAIDDQIVPQTTTRVADADLYSGETQVADAGQPGVIRLVYALTYADNRLISRRLTSRTQTQAMHPEVVQVGTKARPTYTVDSDGLDWSALADCESGGNPGSVSGDGQYYGLYQFSLGTWAAVGGSGLPSDASASEQTYRAQLEYQRAGRGAWPICGQYL
jgi:uncharacterized protein YabE (DUF348 family)